MYREKIVNATTGEITFRDYNDEEISLVEQAQKEAKLKAKEKEILNNTRKSALAKLAALGLTEDEIAAL